MSDDLVQILLVEDNPGDVLLTRKAFERSRLVNRLEVVGDGEAALDYLYRRGEFTDAKVPDLVLLDINLPKLDGHEVLAVIKNDPTLRSLPVIMLTGSDREADVLASYEQHANAYMTKPPDLTKLVDAMRTLEAYWFAMVRRPRRHDE